MKRVVSAEILILLLASMLALTFNIQPANGDIVIVAPDGSVWPPTAPIQRVGNVYTFTADIYDSIVVDIPNIVIDGAGYTLQGNGSGIGIDLTGRTNVTVANVNIKGFTCGIYFYCSSNNTISGNNITNNQYGIQLWYSNNNTISGNRFVGGSLNVFNSYWNVVINNTVNGKPLVYLEGASHQNVADAGQVILVKCEHIQVKNLNLSNTTIGIELRETNHTTISGNNITNNEYGIDLDNYSNNNTISRNNITHNGCGIGPSIFSSNIMSGNKISGNNITNNIIGIYFYCSSNNTISGNNIANNSLGVFLVFSSDNYICHNDFINNTSQIYTINSTNIWDYGYPSGGNYWSDYSGVDYYSGPNQNLPGSDGIGDTPYVIDANNTDRYPLVNPWSPVPGFLITASPTSLTIQRGNSDTSAITVTSTDGFNQPVQLTMLQVPIGATATLNLDRITPPPDGSATSTLTVSVNATAPLGTYTFLIVGTNGTLSHNVTITLEILAVPPYHININPSEFSLMPGESITLIATLTDSLGGPIPNKTINWDISGDPLLSGTLKINNSLTDYAGQAFAIYTAGDVPCETLVIVSSEVYELQLESWGSVQGKILPSPPLIIPLLMFGVFLLLTRTLPHRNLRRALITILILGFSFVLSYPLGFSSHFSSLVLSAKVPAWFLAGLLFLSIVAIAFSILEQSSKYGLIFGICCSIGIILGLLLPNPESSMAYESIDAILIALSPTIVEGLIFSGTLAVFARIGPRIDIARIRHSVKNAEKKYNEGNLLQAARLYAKALSTSLKTNYKDVKALNEGYVRLTRKIIYQAIFRGKEEDKKTLQFAIELQKTLKNKLLSASHEANKIGTIDFLLEKAENNDLDFIVNDALNDNAFLKSFLEKINKSEILIAELAKELDYSIEATKKLLQEAIEKYKIEGFLTLDKNKYISKHYLAKILYETIEKAISKNNRVYTTIERKGIG
jgi:parallel beta-helix repeat protein